MGIFYMQICGKTSSFFFPVQFLLGFPAPCFFSLTDFLCSFFSAIISILMYSADVLYAKLETTIRMFNAPTLAWCCAWFIYKTIIPDANSKGKHMTDEKHFFLFLQDPDTFLTVPATQSNMATGWWEINNICCYSYTAEVCNLETPT